MVDTVAQALAAISAAQAAAQLRQDRSQSSIADLLRALGIPPAAPPADGLGLLGYPYPAPTTPPDWFALNKFFAPPKRRVFTSFQMVDHWAIQYLREIKTSPDFDLEFYDESIVEPFDSVSADYIRRKLRERIGRTSVTVCLVGQTTRQSKWVDFELFESFKKGNRVIGMGLPGGPSRVPYPRFFEQAGAPVKPWNVDVLRALITTASEPRPFE